MQRFQKDIAASDVEWEDRGPRVNGISMKQRSNKEVTSIRIYWQGPRLAAMW